MIRALLIVSGSAFLLGLAYALITWGIGRKYASPRSLVLIASCLIIMHHAVAGIIVGYSITVTLQLILFKTIMVPWSYGFAYGPLAYWCALAIQAVVAVIVGAGICASLAFKKHE